jgi:hypothetical protein
MMRSSDLLATTLRPLAAIRYVTQLSRSKMPKSASGPVLPLAEFLFEILRGLLDEHGVGGLKREMDP